MEQLLIQIFSGTLNVEMLLLLLIVAFVTKRIVPWWVHEETLEELKKYELDAPQVLDAVEALIGLVKETRTDNAVVEQANKVEEQTRRIRTRYPTEEADGERRQRRDRDGPYDSAHRRRANRNV